MPLNIAEIRRIENIEHAVAEARTLVEHLYQSAGVDRPPLPEHPGEYGLRGLTVPTVTPAALDQLIAGLSDADRKALLDMFTRTLAPKTAETVQQG